MTREEMIDELVEDFIESFSEEGHVSFIESVIREGLSFKPYDAMTDEEIREEYTAIFGSHIVEEDIQ